MKKTLSTRAIAAQILYQVIEKGLSFQPKQIRVLFPNLSAQQAAFVAHLCFGVLRHYGYLRKILTKLMPKPFKKRDDDLNGLILIGLFQLLFSDTPDYAAISDTVEGCVFLKKPWAKGLINGILRNAQRLQLSDPIEDIAAACHPEWLKKAIEQSWPLQANEILQTNISAPPMVLRVNRQKTNVSEYISLLSKEEMIGDLLPECPDALRLEQPVPVEALPNFAQGWVSVQDSGAQLAAELLPLAPGMRILDACAAPGGKMAHLLEHEPQLKMVALERDPQRFLQIAQTLSRLSFHATQHCVDAKAVSQWWDGHLFDAIILDAPCSATGIIRRHPDILHHRQPEDVTKLADEQQTLLHSLWPLLKPNGILLYITCSLLPTENVEQIEHFMATHHDAQEWPITASWGQAQSVGRQLLPNRSATDGFYYARLQKQG